MKRAFRFSVLFLVVLGFMACASTQTGPTSDKPFEVKAWSALNFSIASYDAAMLSLKELYSQGMIPKETAQKAWDAGEAFYLAQKGTITALRSYIEIKNATNKESTNKAIGQAALRLADFTKLVTPLIATYLIKDLEKAEVALKSAK
jgi:hypothetical protein